VKTKRTNKIYPKSNINIANIVEAAPPMVRQEGLGAYRILKCPANEGVV